MTTQRTIEFAGWETITDVPCTYKCEGTLRWAEAGYVPGYRICDGCGRHFSLSDDGTTLAPNGRRDRAAAFRADRARAIADQELHMAVYAAMVAVREGCRLYLGTVSWDRHPYYQPERLDELADRVGGPNMPHGLAALMDGMRRTAYPAAWTAWEALRGIIPAGISIHVYPDGQQVTLIGKWTLGEYLVAELLAPQSSALSAALSKHQGGQLNRPPCLCIAEAM